jgi:BMFP domain-containing protein YqiC
MDLHISGSSYICGMEWRAKHLVSAQQLTPVMGGLYEGQLVVWDVADAHNDVFTRQTKFHIYGEPPIYLQHNYFSPPVGKIVHFSEREDGLYVALKLDRPLEDVSGIHLSVGGFAIGEAREGGTYEIKEFAVFEASLTPTPAQPNSEIALLMKTLTNMATEKEKVTLENASGQAAPNVVTTPGEADHVREKPLAVLDALANELEARIKALENRGNAHSDAAGPATQQKAITPSSALGYLRKQDTAQLEAIVSELIARVEALEAERAQLAELQRRLADLEAAVSQIQGMTQEAVAQSIEKALKAVKEQIQPLTNEFAKDVLLLAEVLKKIKTQRI